MVLVRRGLSIVSVMMGLAGSIISSYLFTKGTLKFETMFWVIIGLLFFIGIIIYQDISSELEDQKLEQQKLNEKLKIYKRLSKIEERLKIKW